jgi:drug/metabolite transporter (DMT)-like permease
MDTRLPLDNRAAGLMLLLCLTWSLQQISLKAAADAVGPMLMVALRSGIAALGVAALMYWKGEGLALSQGRWRPGLLAGSLFALEYLLVAEALRLTHASHVAVFLYTAPAFAALGLHLRLPAERLAPLQWAGLGVAFAGVALAFLGRGGPQADLATSQVLLGDLLALLGGVSWGATTVAIRCSSLSNAPASETLLYQLVCAFAWLLPAAFLSGQGHFHAGPTAWLHLGFQSLIVSLASFLLWFWLLRRYLASRLGVFSFLTPVFGVVLGMVLLGEPLDPAFAAGGGLVLAGVLLVGGHGWIASRWPGRRAAPQALR